MRLKVGSNFFDTHCIKRACVPLITWIGANMSNIREVNYLEYGWEMCDGVLMPKCTEDEVAPEDLVALVSCNCNGKCCNNHCTCKKNNVACTDFCGCGDSCQNTDMCPPTNLCTSEDEFEDVEETELDESENEMNDGDGNDDEQVEVEEREEI